MAARVISVLYARKNSVYKSMPGLDVWDEARDARLYRGAGPVIAHPPCRAWGRYAQWAKPGADERDLAFHALSCVRDGGVLEHPRASKLWKAAGLPLPGDPPDRFGGWTLEVNQCDWGHRALKPTWLYVVGVDPDNLPGRPAAGVPVRDVEHMGRAEREATPPRFASWLVQLANRVHTSPLAVYAFSDSHGENADGMALACVCGAARSGGHCGACSPHAVNGEGAACA